MIDIHHLYDTDYSEWARRNAELLRSGDFSALDIEHLLEELNDRGKSERRELKDRLTVLIAHLLKWQYQLPQLSERWREFDGRSWRATLIEQRDRLNKRLRETPGLRSVLADCLPEAYADAVALAVKEAGLPQQIFPAKCPYVEAQLLDEEYYPEPDHGTAGEGDGGTTSDRANQYSAENRTAAGTGQEGAGSVAAAWPVVDSVSRAGQPKST